MKIRLVSITLLAWLILLVGLAVWKLPTKTCVSSLSSLSPAQKCSTPVPQINPEMRWRMFLAALVAVESGGDLRAYNAAEQAAGPYQIRPIYLQDVNRIRKLQGLSPFAAQDRYDLEKATQMVVTYLSWYGRPSRLHHLASYADLARIHNGGPNGWKKESTRNYAERVMRIMHKLEKETQNGTDR